ncbi:MAG: hypothetical protein Q4D98_06325 [Planctomycetia bacterium]|nr:hypothetical protein [Planctomycetia bacterium]
MKKWFLVVVFLGWATGGLAQESRAVSQLVFPEGRRVLCVSFPCDVYPGVSLEVRLLDDVTREHPDKTKPVYFQKDFLKRRSPDGIQVSDELARCYLGDEDDLLTRELTLQETLSRKPGERANVWSARMKFFGWKSVVGPREAAVWYEELNKRTGKIEGTLIFPDATHCPLGMAPTRETPNDRRMFVFDLYFPELDQPCDLQVWLLRGDKVLVSQKIHWLGQGQ